MGKMNSQDNQENLVHEDNFYFLPSHSPYRVIGVGNCGCNIVDEMFRVDRHTIPGVDLLIVENNVQSLDGWAVEEKYLAISPAKDANGILKEYASMLFFVADMSEDYSAQMVTELCRQFHKEEKEYDYPGKVSIVLSVSPFESRKENGKVAKNIADASSVATKVIIVDNNPTRTQYADMPMTSSSSLVTKTVSDIIGTICRIFLEHDYACVDYNDVAMLLLDGNKATYGVGIGEGVNRSEKAVGELKRSLERNGDKIENAKSIMLLALFPHSRPPLVEEWHDAINLLRKSLHHDANILWNASADKYVESDTIAFHAIAIN